MVEIKQLQYNQIEGVLALENECFKHPWTFENIETHYNSPNSYFFVAVGDDETLAKEEMTTEERVPKVLGYIGTYMVMDECFVTNVAVTESARGKGIGSMLVEKATNTAELSGASFITLEVRMSNSNAIGLYKKYGFVLEGVRPNFYRDPDEDAFIMTKRYK